MNYNKNWARIDTGSIPDIKVTPPGLNQGSSLKSRKVYERLFIPG